MLSYATPATIARNNAAADRIMEAKGHGPDRHVTAGKVKTDKFMASLEARKQG